MTPRSPWWLGPSLALFVGCTIPVEHAPPCGTPDAAPPISAAGDLARIELDDVALLGETVHVEVEVNLTPRAGVLTAAWDPADPFATSNFATSATVYDSLLLAHDVTIYFRKEGAGAWAWHATVDGAEISGGTPGLPHEGAFGTLTFDTTGALTAGTTTSSAWDFAGATAGRVVEFGFSRCTGRGETSYAVAVRSY